MNQQNTDYLREAQILLWVQWIFFSAFGWVAGLLFIRGFEFTAYTQFGVTAGFMALCQWFVLRKYTGQKAPYWAPIFMIITGIGAAAGQFGAQALFSALPYAMQDSIYSGFIPSMVFGGAIGIIFGLAVGTTQSILLLGRIHRPYVWILVNIVGWGIGNQFAALIQLSAVVGSLISAVMAAIFTGLWVMQILSNQ